MQQLVVTVHSRLPDLQSPNKKRRAPRIFTIQTNTYIILV